MQIRVQVDDKWKTVELKPPRVKHKGKPSEPFSKEGEQGYVYRMAPGFRNIPAMAYVQWDGYATWERLKDLRA